MKLKKLNKKLKGLGLATIQEILNPTAMDTFHAHAGVTDLKTFEEWLLLARKEFVKMQATQQVKGKEDTELFEWVLAHNSTLGTVVANFRAAMKDLKLIQQPAVYAKVSEHPPTVGIPFIGRWEDEDRGWTVDHVSFDGHDYWNCNTYNKCTAPEYWAETPRRPTENPKK